jgi:tetratricopeptide (TPR) repeat protein
MKTFLVVGLVMAFELAAQPKVKSKKEQEAWMAVVQAQGNPDAQIAAIETLLTKFADTELKPFALQIAMDAAQQKNDTEKTVIYAERALEADPKSYTAMLTIARVTAQGTKEFDFDKEEKLKKVDKLSNEAIEILKTAPKPNPALPDDQWEAAKKDMSSQGYEALGMAAMIRKKYDDAANQFKAAIDSSSSPEGALTSKVRMASALNLTGKFDDALAILNPMLADANLNPAIRQFAAQEKVKAAMGKVK